MEFSGQSPLDSASEHAPTAHANRALPKAQMHRQLWQLAQDASHYLRRHASPAVRLATALLLAASLAACGASATETPTVQQQTVAPLTEEVSVGMPRAPGTYSIVAGSVFRDQRGIYQFEWLDPGITAGPGHVAHVTRLRLARDDKQELEVLGSDDPVLHLNDQEPIGLIQEVSVGNTQPGPQYYPRSYSYWSPFLTGMLIGGMRPAYYDPPRTVIVQQLPSSSGQPGGTTATRVEGGTVSDTAKPPAQRVTGVQSAVSGRAGGTGAGNAVSSRNATSGAAVGAGSSASRPSGSSVTAPKSGGFSSGVGSSGGSSAS